MLSSVKNDSAKLRSSVRFPLQLPVSIYSNESQDEGVTQDISSAGVLFHCGRDYAVGAHIRFCISMPAQALGSARDVHVECTGRVVRCTSLGDRNAVGAVIDEYNLVPVS